ncbi:Aste57867_5038 [Aphanomyces stellatus]|uniref:Aste57867_5038 protein n=1 Tax=Aphanomyces stellatus TaxID=120398 RepID=A0A485KDP1_9STRA|nr:hypothetical protein As57867_005025 [Aphanomyces stellatus]VFT82119.1 Aste57867_5038 [Aphanomyces stellatus]
MITVDVHNLVSAKRMPANCKGLLGLPPHSLTHSMLDGRMPMEAVQPVRVKYIKFSSAMDVALLELIQQHNPIAAKHGTRLAMWERVARDFGAQIFDNASACKWQICRDRGNLLLRWFDEGKVDKLFKDESDAANKKKEALLQSLRQAAATKQGSTSPPSPTSDAPHPLMATPVSNASSASSPPALKTVLFPAASPRKQQLYRQASDVQPPSQHGAPSSASSSGGAASTAQPSTSTFHLPSLKPLPPSSAQNSPSGTLRGGNNPTSGYIPATCGNVREKYLPSPTGTTATTAAALLQQQHAASSAARTTQQSPPRFYHAQYPHAPHPASLHAAQPHGAVLPSLLPHPAARHASRKRKADSSTDAAVQLVRVVEQKLHADMEIRRREQQLRVQELNMQHQLLDYLDRAVGAPRRTQHLRRCVISISSSSSHLVLLCRDGSSSDDADDNNAAARLLELLQHKMQFDMQHHAAEMELRADEVELQRRVLTYLARC